MSDELQKVYLKIYKAEKCEDNSDENYDDEKQICAGGDKKVSVFFYDRILNSAMNFFLKDTCQGDRYFFKYCFHICILIYHF